MPTKVGIQLRPSLRRERDKNPDMATCCESVGFSLAAARRLDADLRRHDACVYA
ncbi:MAG: hypothetical protein ABTQ34_08905 [Bdellovibrionales bacterium]